MGRRLVGLVLLLPLAAGCSTGSTQTPTPSRSSASPSVSDVLVATLQGSSDTATPVFDLKPGWELRFEIDSGHLAVDLVDKNHSVARLADYKGPGGGSVYPQQVGSYSLKIVTTGKYVIRVFNH